MRSVRWWFGGLVAMTLASPASAQVAGFSSLGLPALFGQEAPTSRVPVVEANNLRQVVAQSGTPQTCPTKPGFEIEISFGVSNLVEDILRTWTQMWARGDYREAEFFAENAARLDPTNVKARHALVVAQIVNHADERECARARAEMRGLCDDSLQEGMNNQTDKLRVITVNPIISTAFQTDPVGTVTGSCAKGCNTNVVCAQIRQLAQVFGIECGACCGSTAKACPCSAPAAKKCTCAAPVAKSCACAAPPACCCAKPAAAKGCDCCAKACACAAPAVKACTCAAPVSNACACCTKARACAAPNDCCCGKTAATTCACCAKACACAKKCACAEAVGCCPVVAQVPTARAQGFVIVTVPGSNVRQNSAVPVAPPTIFAQSPNVMMPRPMAIPVSRVVEQVPAKRVRLETPQFDAQCNKMTCVGGGDVVLLEGDVEMMCRRQGAALRVTGQRVRVYLNDGTFTVESAVENFAVPAMVPARPVHRIIIPPAVLPTDEDASVLPR